MSSLGIEKINGSEDSLGGIQISRKDCLRFGALLHSRCGLYFPENRFTELEYRLRMAFSSSTCSDMDEFYIYLQDPEASSLEMDILINAVTISETHFFRDAAQINSLEKHVLPKLIEKRRVTKTLRIWSAGCASGEEPYSIAILLKELIPDIANWSITILGTDINTASLERAKKAQYGSWAFREKRALELQKKYFKEDGNRYLLDPAIREMVIFRKLNLVSQSYPSPATNTISMDLILCRNVTIYFSDAVTRWVVDRFYDCLVDDGWLVVGHSEPNIDIYQRFAIRNFPNNVLYQRSSEPNNNFNLPPISKRQEPLIIPPIPVVSPKHTPHRDPLPIDHGTASELITVPNNLLKEEVLDKARELLDYGHAEQALDVIKKYHLDFSPSAKSCALMGQLYADLGDWSNAEYWCSRSIELDKLSLDAYFTRSLIFLHQKQIEEAIESMKKVVYIDRNYILGHYNLANLFFEQRSISQALKSLDNAARLLGNKLDDDIVPGVNGITVSRLKEAVTLHRKAWAQMENKKT